MLKAAESAGARLIVTADHGNAEMMIDPETGGPHTAHTTNPVPFVVVDWEQEQRLRSGGALVRCGANYIINARYRAAGGDDRRQSWSGLVKHFLGALALACIATTAQRRSATFPRTARIATSRPRQEFTFFGGHYSAAKDPIGVAPRSGPMFGAPLPDSRRRPRVPDGALVARQQRPFAIDPTKTGTARQLGKHNVSINLFDIDLALNLTGQKSFHHIVPVMNFGGGIGTAAAPSHRIPTLSAPRLRSTSAVGSDSCPADDFS